MFNQKKMIFQVFPCLFFITMVGLSGSVWAGTSGDETQNPDLSGFQGIPWGSSLSNVPGVTVIDSSEAIQTYVYQQHPPRWGGVVVESIKLQSVDGQFARALIRYHGKAVHDRLLRFLVSQFGTIDLHRGSMVRGLNQQYTWEKGDVMISLTYRGLGERGFVDVGSRKLAARLLEQFTDTF